MPVNTAVEVKLDWTFWVLIALLLFFAFCIVFKDRVGGRFGAILKESWRDAMGRPVASRN